VLARNYPAEVDAYSVSVYSPLIGSGKDLSSLLDHWDSTVAEGEHVVDTVEEVHEGQFFEVKDMVCGRAVLVVVNTEAAVAKILDREVVSVLVDIHLAYHHSACFLVEDTHLAVVLGEVAFAYHASHLAFP
jgi:hypothetical protein